MRIPAYNSELTNEKFHKWARFKISIKRLKKTDPYIATIKIAN